MEEILINLFGGGTLDWEDISKTEYDWAEIFERARIYIGNNITINTLYQMILEIALDELAGAMQTCKEETTEEFKNCAYDIYNYFEIYTNCLDTHIYFIGSEELREEIQEKMENKIEEINNKIGFAYIEI